MAQGISLGGAHTGINANYLLDTSPLHENLVGQIDMDAITHFFHSHTLRGVAVSATNYKTGTAVTFFDGAPEIKPWVRSTRLGVRAPVRHEHIMGSSAIPLFFPPIKIGEVFYGDGCIRLNAPLSPAIHLGAEKVLSIGIRYCRTDAQTLEMHQNAAHDGVAVADIADCSSTPFFSTPLIRIWNEWPASTAQFH